ncbi:MAG: lytic transglycosylase domain-containing protein, partial [Paracoccaceae bacterium]
MKQIVAGLLMLVLTSTAVVAQNAQAARAVARAMQAVEAEDWPAAARRVAAAGPVARDIVAWHRLRAGEGEFDEYIEFLARRADWPGLALLRTRGEKNIPENAEPGQVIAYFATQLPRTGAGALRLAAAFSARGEVEKAHDEIVRVWRGLSLDEDSEAAILAAYSGVLVNYHRARQDMLLWRGRAQEAERLNGLVGAAHARLAKARIALMAREDGVNALISAIPGQLADDPGLAFARLTWRMAKRPPGEAAALMLQRSVSAKALGKPELWADKRRRLARTMLREGEPRMAYRLAARHFLTGGDAYADLEWLAGYIALTGLKDYDVALRHFQNARA